MGARKSRLAMVGAAGIEPATPTMSTWCSPAELRALVHQVLDTKTVLACIERLTILSIYQKLNPFPDINLCI